MAAADVTIDVQRMARGDGKENPAAALLASRARRNSICRVEIDVDSIDPARNFEVNSQRARRITHGGAERAENHSAAGVRCGHGQADCRDAAVRLWAERELVQLYRLARVAGARSGRCDRSRQRQFAAHAKIQSGRWVAADRGILRLRRSLPTARALADGGQTIRSSAISAVPDSILYLMDLPLLQPSDDQPGVYAAATGLPSWTVRQFVARAAAALITALQALRWRRRRASPRPRSATVPAFIRIM